jgi:hypothetical protein
MEVIELPAFSPPALAGRNDKLVGMISLLRGTLQSDSQFSS